jgi:hypothetical protein
VWNGQSVSLTKNQSRNLPERDKMKKEELDEWGYPIHPKSDYSKPPEGNFVSWVGVILVFTEISWGILKIVGII